MNKITLQNIIRHLLGALFLVAAVSKFIDPYPFGDFLNSFRVIPGNLIIPTVYIFSCVELILSLLLLFNQWSKSAATILLVGILVATLYSMWLYLSGVILIVVASVVF